MAAIPLASLEYMVNHVVLPPKLPQKAEDSDISHRAERDLIDLLVTQVQVYRRQRARDSPNLDGSWAIIERALARYGQSLSNLPLSTKMLIDHFDLLKLSDVLPIQLRAQNAVLILRRTDSAVIFECFEASATAGPVMAAKGSLIREFPAHAVSLPLTVFVNQEFQRELAHRLAQLDAEVIEEMLPQSYKAGSWTGEVRDTAHPALVTEMLMATLAPLGNAVKVRQIRKRTRDDILWNDCLLPWRRSPVWLTIRVTIQTVLEALLLSVRSTVEYKNFMIFFLAELASKASAIIPDDACHLIIAKIARRASKLGSDLTNFVQIKALEVSQKIKEKLDEKWQAVQKEDRNRCTVLEKRAFKADTALSLDACKSYLNRVLDQSYHEHGVQSKFAPPIRTAWLQWERELPNLDGLTRMTKEETIYALAEFEAWIATSLPSWRGHRFASSPENSSLPLDCAALASLAAKYRDIALGAYNENPEQMSTMYLTIAELWQTLDLLAVKIVPLLGDFSPSIPKDLFNPLLLPRLGPMERLMHIEAHIISRQLHAKRSNPSIFSDPNDKSFAVQYYDSSTRHKDLRKRIEEEASRERSAKKAEWQGSTDTYQRLKQEAKAKTCNDSLDAHGDPYHDRQKCKKCLLDYQADSMTITVHEWPLPDRESSCLSAIFELDCPVGLAAWRNLTWMFIQDLGREWESGNASPAARLSTYAGLETYAKWSTSRLTLASTTKSFAKAHYGELKFPVAADRCLVKNALHYQLFDTKKGLWAREQPNTSSLHSRCTTTLPRGPYSNLQYAVDSTNHSQNQVIADQTSCARSLGLHEFISFGSLRSDGERVQWYNIRRELAASNLSLNNEAVCTLITQAAWQVGSRAESTLRTSHIELANADFCKELLGIVLKVCDSIQANWKSDHTMQILIIVVLRVLSLCQEVEVVDIALDLLGNLRVMGYNWITKLDSALHKASDTEQIAKLQQRILKVAILCKMTFDVDKQYIARVLATDTDVSMWIACSMQIRNNVPGHAEALPKDLRRLFMRDAKSTLNLYRVVRSLVVEDKNSGLDLAVGQAWSSYQAAGYWTIVEASNDRWVRTETSQSPVRASQSVFYNLLDGELLIDGKPLGRLPKNYVSSELYVRVLGAQILHVFKADMSDMLYMSAQQMQGYIVYFGMRGEDIIIKIRNEFHILEVIPHEWFRGDLPNILIEDYVHWMDISTHEIEFRPLNRKWTIDPKNWRLRYTPHSNSKLVRENCKLLDVRSTTTVAVMGIFGPLETLENVHVTLSEHHRLEVGLPRYDLKFFLNNDGYFECNELRRIVDPDQSVGTMIGLYNRLVLCGTQPLARKHDRVLLVPEGEVSVAGKGCHVKASITISGTHVKLFRYQIDRTLRRLHDNGEAQAILYKAYLHAITSHILPDPLTERTGIEEALSYLRRRSLSFTKPPDRNVVRILTSISELTPQRKYYPQHLSVMQQVQWHPSLSMLAQHDEFFPLAQQVIASGNPYVVFYPDSEEAPNLYQGRDVDLHMRAKIRNSAHRSHGLGGDTDVRKFDQHYEARDRSGTSERASRSFTISALVRDWPKKLQVSRSLSAYLSSLGTISGFDTVFDPSRPLSELLKVTFSSSWAPLHVLCRGRSQNRDTYQLLFLFSAIAYSRGVTSVIELQTLLAFAFIREMRDIPAPSTYSYFTPAKGSVLREDTLRSTIKNNMRAYNGPSKKKHSRQWQAGFEQHQKETRDQSNTVFQRYKSQWPCDRPTAPSKSLASHLSWGVASHDISQLFYIWTANGQYRDYLARIQVILNDACCESSLPGYLRDVWHDYESVPEYQQLGQLPPSLRKLMSRNAPSRMSKPLALGMQRPVRATRKNEKLRSLIAEIRSPEGNHSRHEFRAQYRDDLLASHDAFNSHGEQVNPPNLPCTLDDVILNLAGCKSYADGIFKQVRDQLGPGEDPISKLLELGGLWPRITPQSILAYISTKAEVALTPSMKDYLLDLGEAMASVQRARRLVLAAERNDVVTFCMEMENDSHNGWNVAERPDWLLIELEGDFLIRPIQARVALEMIQPSSYANSLVQLNMGEGKSSVIVPLVAVAIADGARLSRVIVLKSLVKQMSDTMYQRLGGLVDRQIYFLPFSRKVRMDDAIVSQIWTLQKSCLEHHGVLLAQPEHLLSFKLMGIERLLSGELGIASELMISQQWLELNTRDILDESDELLDVKFQLIYTLGSQRIMDGQPDRWLVTQGIFDLVEKHGAILESEYPGQIEMKYSSSSSFPHLRILSGKTGTLLVSRLAQDVIDSKLPSLNLERYSTDVKAVILRFFLNRGVSDADCQTLRKIFGDRETYMQKLLLIRGLFAYQLVLFVLRSKRWSVNYGLHPSRCLSAVPYRAKGVPAPSAEFGHPDVAIALTCLSYYYSGLTDLQIRASFELLQKSDDPSLEYLSWVGRCEELPPYLRSWNAVNLEDDRQFREELVPNLRFGKKIADYFMTNVVFPKEGKEFDEKLSTSGWDIVSKRGPHITTGFSGTNDNRFVLPLSISQHDLPELKHTSGKVLDFVLREENLAYHCAQDDRGRQLSTEGLIRHFTGLDSSIQVLIDVGAQVLDTSNHDFVKTWMALNPDVGAGVFFDEDDTVMVLSRDLRLEKLSVSSFQSRMDQCVVYLDEVHTRGTDLKLSSTARAAVTLGPRLTKDRLVQACMRLRKLAQGQTLTFLAPPEVHQKILALVRNGEVELDGYDVVRWALEQSCQSIERSQPLRVLQGLGHSRRQTILHKFFITYTDLTDLSVVDLSSDLVRAFREKEEQRLNDLYAPLALKTNVNPGIIEFSQQNADPLVQVLIDMWKKLDFAASASASMHEEHEREVAHEVEQETQLERPPKVQVLEHKLDPRLNDFVRTGSLETFVRFPLAYDRIVKSTSAAISISIQPWMHLRVSNDFSNTVERPLSGYYDSYLRPTNWALTSKQEVEAGFILLISQYEVNQLLRDIQKASSGVRLHIYEPRVTKAMGSVDFGLDPPPPSMDEWQGLTSGLRRELNLFAGHLYFNTHKDYKTLCKDLGPRLNPSVDQTLSFVKSWIAIRRKGQDFTQTHVGQMISGRSINEESFV